MPKAGYFRTAFVKELDALYSLALKYDIKRGDRVEYPYLDTGLSLKIADTLNICDSVLLPFQFCRVEVVCTPSPKQS